MIYELVNPSDAYIFTAENDLDAAAVALVLGEGWYFAKREDGGDVKSVSPFGGTDADLTALFGQSFSDYLKGRAAQLGVACGSFMLCGIEGRRRFEREAADVDEKTREKLARAVCHERSSLNNIGANAAAYAKYFAELAKAAA